MPPLPFLPLSLFLLAYLCPPRPATHLPCPWEGLWGDPSWLGKDALGAVLHRMDRGPTVEPGLKEREAQEPPHASQKAEEIDAAASQTWQRGRHRVPPTFMVWLLEDSCSRAAPSQSKSPACSHGRAGQKQMTPHREDAWYCWGRCGQGCSYREAEEAEPRDPESMRPSTKALGGLDAYTILSF